MVCKKCGAEEIFRRETFVCPICEKLKILPKDLAMKVVTKQIDWFNQAFYRLLRTFNRKSFVVWLFGEREKIAHSFFSEKPFINLNDFLAVNVLIKRVMKDAEDNGEQNANEKNTKELISLFSTFVEVQERKHLIDEGYGCYVFKEEFDINNLDINNLDVNKLMGNFVLYYTYEWQDIVKSFGNNLIFPEPEGKKYLEKYKEEYEKIQANPPKPEHYSTEETMSHLFPLLQTFLVSLNKNKLFAETFDITYLKESGLSLPKILDLVKSFKGHSGMMNLSSEKDFKAIIKKVFAGHREGIILRNLLFSKENQSIFPFFAKIDNNILTSTKFITLMSLYYFPIYYKSEFDSEIAKRGNDFEKKEVPDKLNELGFSTHSPITDKKKSTLEIDCLAWKDGILYVIECKIWDIKKLFEHRNIHQYRIRDLQGVVDGKSYSMKNGVQVEKDKPSLSDKIVFIKENLQKYCPDYKLIKEIKGLIITKSYPPMKEYKGIRMIAYDELPSLI